MGKKRKLKIAKSTVKLGSTIHVSQFGKLEYTEKDIVSITNDRDKVRKSPTLYLPSVHADGALHAIGEIVDNSIDEAVVRGSLVEVSYDRTTYETTVRDDGAGIPHGSLLNAYTVLATSGKFDNGENTAYTYSGGVFGHGAKLQTFLSTRSEVTSTRDGKYLTYVFEDGILKETKKGKAPADKHGTFTRFRLDPKIMRIDELDPTEIEDWLRQKSYCFPEIEIRYTLLDDGKTVKELSFTGHTIYDLAKSMKPDTEVIRITDTRKRDILKEYWDDKTVSVTVDMDIAIAFSEKALDGDTDSMVTSYVNSIHTYSGGTQVDGVKTGLVKYVKEVAIPKMSKKDQELPITPSDITSGLCGVVSVRLSRPEFAGQHKERLTNQEVKFMVRDAVFDALNSLKPAQANEMMAFIKRVARGRLASKKTMRKDVDNAFSKFYDPKYARIHYTKNTTWPELLLVEGDSAAGVAISTRDPDNQAVFGIKKPKNVFDVDSETLTQRATSVFNDICDKANITPGKRCDPSKCVFVRILMLTDADVDGDAIAVAVIGLFWKHCRPIVDAGIIGRVLPPAYMYVDRKGRKHFIRSKREMFEQIMSKAAGSLTVASGDHEMTKGELYDFLSTNFDYPKELEDLARWHCCDERLMEYIAWNYHGNPEDQSAAKWRKILKRGGYDMVVRDEGGQVVIDDNVKGEDYVNLVFDETFAKHMAPFKKIQSMNDQIDNYSIDGAGGKSLYEVMTRMRNYMPSDIERFKGLGEMDHPSFKEICMDPGSRTVIIMKSRDIEAEEKKISIILSTKDSWQRARVELLSRIAVASRDLDT